MTKSEQIQDKAQKKAELNESCLDMLSELKEHYVTQRYVSKILSIKQSTMSEIISGKRLFPNYRIEKLIEVFEQIKK